MLSGLRIKLHGMFELWLGEAGRGSFQQLDRLRVGLGVAYKKDVDDARESPALSIIDLLQKKGAVILYHDPYIPSLPRFRKYHFELKSSTLTEQLLHRIDAAVIVTDHSSIDYQWVVKHAPLVIDTLNVTKNMKQWRKKIVKA